MAHTVIRTDLMPGTDVASDLVSLRYYVSTTKTEIDNGAIVKIGDLETGEREIRKATAAANDDAIRDLAVIATPEVMYDERKKNLDEFYNEAGAICRGYRLDHGRIFSITADGFASSPTSLTVGAELGIGSNGKVATSVTSGKTKLGTLIAIETTKRYTYYVIEVA